MIFPFNLNFLKTDTVLNVSYETETKNKKYNMRATLIYDMKKVTTKTFKVIQNVALCHLILSHLLFRCYTAKDKDCMSNRNMS